MIDFRRLGKKSMFLSLIALLILILFAFTFSLQNIIVSSYKEDIVRTRVNIADDYVSSLFETYIPNSAETAVYYAFDHIATHGDEDANYYATYDDKLSLIKNGVITRQGEDPEVVPALGNKKLEYWFLQINKTSTEYLNIDTDIEVTSITLSQQEPWYINVTLDVNVKVNAELAKWDTSRLIETKVSIVGLRDKLIVDNKGQKLPNINYFPGKNVKIKNTVDFKLVDDYDWEVSDDNSLGFINKIRSKDVFVHYPGAPSYLDRLKGDYEVSSECCGIFYFVDYEDELEDDPPKLSSADYCFYNKIKKREIGCGPMIRNYKGFKLSDQQAREFNIEKLRTSKGSDD